ncbi:MAG: DUF3604 domain-containing protein [Nitriliruptoraceae bacterium]
MRDQATWVGTATISPDTPVVAGAFGTWTITITVGRYGIDNSGSAKIAIQSVTDWGLAQLDNPKAPNFATVRHTGEAKARARFEPYGGVRPWARVLLMEVYDGSLAEGDTIEVTWGDTSGGSPGCRAQTYPQDGFEFRVLIDNFGTGVYETLTDSPRLKITSGPVHQWSVVAPSTLEVGETTSLLVRAEDIWGNATPCETEVSLEVATCSDGSRPTVTGLPSTISLEPADGGVVRVEGVSVGGVATLRFVATDGVGRSATSNPTIVGDRTDGKQLVWGDTQGQSGGTIGTGSLTDFYRYARDIGGLDFVVHSGNDFQITKALWELTRQTCTDFHEPHRFITFLSYEWSGNTPGGGDFNIIYSHDDGPLHRSSHWLVDDRSDEDTDRYPVSELWKEYEGRDDVIGVAHIGGRRADLSFVDERFCPIIEITSVHGQFEWFAREALARGLKVGFVGASDDHSGRPGASSATSHGKLPVKGGFAGVFASELTREGLFEAMKARRCFATTGARIHLDVRCDGHWMGEDVTVDGSPTLEVAVAGTAPIEKVEILRGTDVIHTHDVAGRSDGIRIAWSGARVDTRGRHTRWDGGLTLSEGRILAATPWSFDVPIEGVELVDDRTVTWVSGTSGDTDGVVLDLDAPDDAEIAVDTKVATMTFNVGDVGEVPIVVEAGGVEQRITVDRAPNLTAPTDASFMWSDPDPIDGEQPYWVKVTQLDGDLAWSSPHFITVR